MKDFSTSKVFSLYVCDSKHKKLLLGLALDIFPSGWEKHKCLKTNITFASALQLCYI